MRRVALPVLCLVLAGCGQHGVFRDRGYDYLRAEVGKPLVYPEGLTPIPAQELYPIPGVEQRRVAEPGKKKPGREVPPPPQIIALEEETTTADAQQTRAVVPEAKILLTRDGNDYPVLMLDLDFDWAWQAVGDALPTLSSVKVGDLDRELGVYYLVVDGRKNSADEPWQLKLNYTANGIQVALQVDENAMAPADLSGPLMEKLREAILKGSERR